MRKMLNNFAKEKRIRNIIQYNFYFKRIKRMLLTLFLWEGLPEGITSKFIEKVLFENGLIIFYKSEGGFLACSRVTVHGYNEYDEPLYFQPVSGSKNISLKKKIKREDCVCIYNDVLQENNVGNAHFFANKLEAIDNVIECNMEHLKIPFVITCSEGQKETVKIMLQKKTEGEPYILATDDMSGISTKLWAPEIKNNIPALEDEKRIILNDCLTFFGINNVNISKKERLISGETEANNEEINLNLNAMYEERLSKVAIINEKFGTNISVKINKYASKELLDKMEEV